MRINRPANETPAVLVLPRDLSDNLQIGDGRAACPAEESDVAIRSRIVDLQTADLVSIAVKCPREFVRTPSVNATDRLERDSGKIDVVHELVCRPHVFGYRLQIGNRTDLNVLCQNRRSGRHTEHEQGKFHMLVYYSKMPHPTACWCSTFYGW